MTRAAPIPSRYPPPGILARGWLALLSLIGLAMSCVLLAQTLGEASSLAGCGPGSACDTVLRSPWSSVLRVPVAAPAIVLYAIVLASLPHIGRRSAYTHQRVAWRVLLLVAVGLLAAAAWFTWVQYALIGMWCVYCSFTHGIGVALGLSLLAMAPIGRPRIVGTEPADPLLIAPSRAMVWLTLGLVGAAAMPIIQTLTPPPTVRVGQFGGIVGRPASDPVLGSPQADFFLLSLSDYTCPHCRTMHHQLSRVLEHFGGRVAVVAMPVPLEADCNPAMEYTEPRHEGACELAKLALAVWRVDPGQYAAYDAWLFETPQPPSPTEARARAEAMVDAGELARVLASDWPGETIRRNVQLFEAAGGRSLPLLIINQATISGQAGRAEDLIQLLQRELGLD